MSKNIFRIIALVLAVLIVVSACSGSKPEAPAAEQPAAGQPAAEQPAAGQPAAGQPAAEQPAAGQPAAQQPAAQQPAAQQPAGNMITFPNGKQFPRPTSPFSLENIMGADTLGMWQLPGRINKLLVDQDGVTIYAALGATKTAGRGALYRWRIDSNEAPKMLVETNGSINAIRFTPDHRYLVYGSQGNEIVYYDLQTDTPGQNLIASGTGVTAVAISPTEPLIVWSMYEDYSYYQYTNGTQNGKFGYRLGTVVDMEFSPNGSQLAQARDDGSLFVIDTSGWQLVKSLPIGNDGQEPLSSVTFSTSGALAAVTGAKQGTMWVVDTASWKPVVTLQTGEAYNQATFSPNGDILLIGNDQNGISVFNLTIRNRMGMIKPADSPVVAVAFSPDGTFLLCGDQNGNVRLLTPKTMINPGALPGAQPTTNP